MGPQGEAGAAPVPVSSFRIRPFVITRGHTHPSTKSPGDSQAGVQLPALHRCVNQELATLFALWVAVRLFAASRQRESWSPSLVGIFRLLPLIGLGA